MLVLQYAKRLLIGATSLYLTAKISGAIRGGSLWEYFAAALFIVVLHDVCTPLIMKILNSDGDFCAFVMIDIFINAFVLISASKVAFLLDLGFHVEDFAAALTAALIIQILTIGIIWLIKWIGSLFHRTRISSS